MKLFRVVLIYSLIHLIVVSGTAGQMPTPEAILVDEYEITSCDEFLGRLDGYLSEMRNAPDSSGLIILRTAPSKRHLGVELQAMIEAHLRWRGFDSARIEIIRTDGKAPLRQFWRIPPGANRPNIDGQVLGDGYHMAEEIRAPFLLASETKFGTQICPEVDDEVIFANFLKGNSSARGNIVVRNHSLRRARAMSARILKRFQIRHGISRTRLRTFTAHLTGPPNHDEPIVEYWYLP